MNSRNKSDNSQRAATSFNNHDFDFGLGFSRSSSGSSSLNAQKEQNAAPNTYATGGGGGASWAQKPASSSSSPWIQSSPLTSSSSSSSAAAWSWQSSSGSGALHGPPRSMVGDITGKSWGSMDSTKGNNVNSGVVGGLSRGASPNLFGDLLGAARPSSLNRQQLQPQAPQGGYKSPAFSNLEAMAAMLPKGVPMKDAKSAKVYQTEEMGDFVSAGSATNASSQDAGWSAFEAISSKPKSGFTDQAKMPQKSSHGDPFGDFQGVPSTKATTPVAASTNMDPFAASSNFSGNMSKPSASSSGDFFNFVSTAAAAAPSSRTQTSKKADAPGFSNSIDLDPFAFLISSKTTTAAQPINTQQSDGSDPFESVFGKISSASTQTKLVDPVMDTLWGSTKPQPVFSKESAPDSWGIETDFGGGANAETTTELDGLPPPPPGVSAALSKDKGLEYYKQGQFADAIKWLSWAEVLLHQSGDSSQIIEVLICRSSCLKEAGEYKKAVADCSQAIELDDGNTSILLQRALLYESMEKYKLGIADLKEVLRREPQNRLANNTLARLKKMGD